MANEQNLLTPEERNLTSEEASKMGKLGGIASGESRRKKKVFTEIISTILGQDTKSEMANVIRKAFGVKDENLTVKEAMVYAQVMKAIEDQDTAAFKTLVEIIDGKPVTRKEGEATEINVFQSIVEPTSNRIKELVDDA